MKVKFIVTALLVFFASYPFAVSAQMSFEEYKNQQRTEFDSYKEKRRKEFEAYRRARNEEFARYMREAWGRVHPSPVVPKPKDEPRPPVVAPKDEPAPVVPAPVPLPFDEVLPAPKPTPQPEPIRPIEEVPVAPVTPVSPKPQAMEFSFFGTSDKVRFDKKDVVHINGLNEDAVADAWLKLSDEKYSNLIYDCLQIRKERKLGDWAYLMMLKKLSEAACGSDSNDAVLLMAFLYCQSGYKMRLGMADNRLYMMFASRHKIFDWGFYKIDGEDFYVVDKKEGEMRVCSQEFPNEKPLSLLIGTEQVFAPSPTSASKHQSTKFPDMSVSVAANKNRLDFYSSYPTSMVGENMVSRWAMYANMPLPSDIKKQLYPVIKAKIQGLDQLAAVSKILNWVQTGFVYEFDDKVWGQDRAFFPEESLHYPYCDCEDRSILFTRIVRDVLGLKCVLIYYPGHLAAAVEMGGNTAGDYVQLDGCKFTVADPTYVNAPVGKTMPDMDNGRASVILLE